jgi:hypothetical protein
MRHTYFPNPTDGNDKHSYFAFEWGNALFIGLDPFWSTMQRGASGWDMTLGEAQYRWLNEDAHEQQGGDAFCLHSSSRRRIGP